MITTEKNNEMGIELTIGSIAAQNYHKAEVFKRRGIDFCCGGNKTIKEACLEADVSESELRSQLDRAGKLPAMVSQDYNKWELDFLADYIVNTHHKYVKENAEMISELAQKVARHHGKNHLELEVLSVGIQQFMQEMLTHMDKEEKALFPEIKLLTAIHRKQPGAISISPGTVKNAIKIMQTEHEMAGEDLRLFREKTQDYQLPADACNSYNLLFEKMKEFEDDLAQHIHLENNILFPKAILLDEEPAC